MPKPETRAHSPHAQNAVKLLGNLIRVGRIEAKMTLRELAERANVSIGLVQRIERGEMGSSIGVAFELAAIVGVPLFADDRTRVARWLTSVDDRLALLPETARRPSRAVDDDF